jgi:hypothetical protein
MTNTLNWLNMYQAWAKMKHVRVLKVNFLGCYLAWETMELGTITNLTCK